MQNTTLEYEIRKLERFADRLKRHTTVETYKIPLSAFWTAVTTSPLHKYELSQLCNEAELSEVVNKGVDARINGNRFNDRLSETDHLKYCAVTIQKLCDPSTNYSISKALLADTQKTEQSKIAHDQRTKAFTNEIVLTVIDYLISNLDQQKTVLASLLRYKHSVEWFGHDYVLTESEPKLAKHIYKYLHDQGHQFTIEPTSASGRVDLISKDLVLDVKVYQNSVNQVKSAFSQVNRYLNDYNRPVGYVLALANDENRIFYELHGATEDIPYLEICQRRLYVVDVDLFAAKRKSASKDKKIKNMTLKASVILKELEQ
jgi:hypothetical protein